MDPESDLKRQRRRVATWEMTRIPTMMITRAMSAAAPSNETPSRVTPRMLIAFSSGTRNPRPATEGRTGEGALILSAPLNRS